MRGGDQLDQARRRARVLVVDLAPDLAVLLERTFPGAEIRIASQADALDRLLLASWDALVVDLDTLRLGQILPHVDRLRVVGVTSSADRARDHGELADVLLRPVLGEDLRRTMGRLLGHAAVTSPEERRLARVRAAIPLAKVVALVLGWVIDVVLEGSTGLGPVLATAALVLCTARLRSHDVTSGHAWTVLDIVLGGVLLLVTGGPESSYLLFAWVLAADAGLRFPWRGVATTVIALFAATVPGGVVLWGEAGGPQTWAAVVVVAASVSAVTALIRRTWQSELDGATSELEELHEALTTVSDHGPRLLGGLTLSGVADRLLEELASRWRASAGVVLVEHGGAFVEASSRGLHPHGPVLVEATDPLAVVLQESARPRGVADVVVPDTLRLATPNSEAWILTPLHHEGAPVGAVLWTGRRHLTERTRLELRPFGRRGGLAIATAMRFEQLRSTATDTERRRLRDALDGDVFQSVLSLRYELELLARHRDDVALRPQLDRLSALARDVAAHLRTTAGCIGIEIDARGLGAALRNHCRDLQRLTAVRLELDLRTQQRPDRDAEVVTYELAIAAINRAVASPDASRVEVRLLDVDGATVVEVEHDGARTIEAGNGLARTAARAAEFGVSVRLAASAGRTVTRITATPFAFSAEGVTS